MTRALTEAQMNIALDIIRSGRAELSKGSTPDYVIAAAFVFDNGFMSYPRDMVATAISRAALSRDGRGDG